MRYHCAQQRRERIFDTIARDVRIGNDVVALSRREIAILEHLMRRLGRVVPKAVVCGLTGRKLPLQGGGRARKSYIHARDLARAIHLVSENAPLGKVYNAGPSAPISIRDLVAKVAEGFKIPFDQLCEITGDRLGQDSQYWLDSSAITQDVGWQPQISLEEGIQEMIAWGRKYLDFLKDYPTDYVLRA